MFQVEDGFSLALLGGFELVCLGFANLEAAVTRVARVKGVSGAGQERQIPRQVP